jgi:hypothetical protein
LTPLFRRSFVPRLTSALHDVEIHLIVSGSQPMTCACVFMHGSSSFASAFDKYAKIVARDNKWCIPSTCGFVRVRQIAGLDGPTYEHVITRFLSLERRINMGQRRRFPATATWAPCSSTSATICAVTKTIRRCPVFLRRLGLNDRLVILDFSAAPVLAVWPSAG